MSEAISFRLEAFEGPLDLLLHLIDRNKVNIYDIPIAEITDQYMAYVNAMDKEDLDLVSDFLVMAATLLDIKSKMLLPVEVTEDGEEGDPRAELVERLLQYKMFKYMAGELKGRQTEAERMLYKPETVPDEVKKYQPPVDLDEVFAGVTLTRLNDVFQAVLRRKEDRVDPIRAGFKRIQKEPFRVADKITEVLLTVAGEPCIGFETLLSRQRSKIETVVTFLAILELMKMGHITVSEEADGLMIRAAETLTKDADALAAEIAGSIEG